MAANEGRCHRATASATSASRPPRAAGAAVLSSTVRTRSACATASAARSDAASPARTCAKNRPGHQCRRGAVQPRRSRLMRRRDPADVRPRPAAPRPEFGSLLICHDARHGSEARALRLEMADLGRQPLNLALMPGQRGVCFAARRLPTLHRVGAGHDMRRDRPLSPARGAALTAIGERVEACGPTRSARRAGHGDRRNAGRRRWSPASPSTVPLLRACVSCLVSGSLAAVSLTQRRASASSVVHCVSQRRCPSGLRSSSRRRRPWRRQDEAAGSASPHLDPLKDPEIVRSTCRSCSRLRECPSPAVT